MVSGVTRGHIALVSIVSLSDEFKNLLHGAASVLRSNPLPQHVADAALTVENVVNRFDAELASELDNIREALNAAETSGQGDAAEGAFNPSETSNSRELPDSGDVEQEGDAAQQDEGGASEGGEEGGDKEGAEQELADTASANAAATDSGLSEPSSESAETQGASSTPRRPSRSASATS